MNLLTKIRRYRWALTGRRKIKTIILQKKNNNEAIKIILGAGNHSSTNGEWINTDLPQFDITKAEHWEYFFGAVKIDNLFAEHVFEHLNTEQNKTVLKLAQQHLKPTGIFRIAVPDRNNPDPVYQAGTKPGGQDIGSDDHKVFFNLDNYKQLIKETGFKIIPLEYFDENNHFIMNDFDNENGYVLRSKKNKFNYPPIPNYTSLIFDLKLSEY